MIARRSRSKGSCTHPALFLSLSLGVALTKQSSKCIFHGVWWSYRWVLIRTRASMWSKYPERRCSRRLFRYCPGSFQINVKAIWAPGGRVCVLGRARPYRERQPSIFATKSTLRPYTCGLLRRLSKSAPHFNAHSVRRHVGVRLHTHPLGQLTQNRASNPIKVARVRVQICQQEINCCETTVVRAANGGQLYTVALIRLWCFELCRFSARL